jgi:hypothetical protein
MDAPATTLKTTHGGVATLAAIARTFRGFAIADLIAHSRLGVVWSGVRSSGALTTPSC